MTNLGLELALENMGIPFARAQVGDRFVVAEMGERGWMLGGETSGHVVCGHATGTGDGLVTALQAVSAVVQQDKSLHELSAGFDKLPQVLINVPIAQRVDLDEQTEIQVAVATAQDQLGDAGRVLLRPRELSH